MCACNLSSSNCDPIKCKEEETNIMYESNKNDSSKAKLYWTVGIIIAVAVAALLIWHTFFYGTENGTAAIGAWENLSAMPDGNGAATLADSTLLAGQGSANLIGVTNDISALSAGSLSHSLLAVSDFLRGETTYETGPLVHKRDCFEAGTMHRVPDGVRERQQRAKRRTACGGVPVEPAEPGDEAGGTGGNYFPRRGGVFFTPPAGVRGGAPAAPAVPLPLIINASFCATRRECRVLRGTWRRCGGRF